MNTAIEQDITSWVEQAETAENKEFREAVHTILSAISQEPNLKANMVLKGGILLAIRYQSHRYTKDIDLSTEKKLADINPDVIATTLDQSLTLTAETLDYDLECKVQSVKVRPANRPDATYPSIKLVVGHAYKGTPKHKRLQALSCPTTISIDYSLNESTPYIDSVEISDGENLLAYSLTDLIAEKIRSLLQQKERNRNRRQDIFDLHLVLTECEALDDIEKHKTLESLLIKARSRGIEPNIESFDDREIRDRAAADYHTLADEVDGSLPNFDEAYEAVRNFYLSLPWDRQTTENTKAPTSSRA